ncbi:hypothetical protein [Capnocytophaga ochracea]|uniref:Uncharacterized protein n=1 Tax=Capnocytophaga ochracea TaxID=1018 RepID=A0AA46W6E6_CAPOC|nr:hypothetical protein [Capnocytophaga ochracea]UZD40236.1 hypothetical protein OL231_08630 [Capnocytophaga ochracea]
MKIQNNNLKCPDSPYIPIMKPNTFFANKKVQTTYKEYEAVEDENNTVRLGAFKDYELFIPEAIQTLIREYCEMAETLYDIDSFDKKTEIQKIFNFRRYSRDNKYFTTTYNDKGFITSYEIDYILIAFKYNKNDQIIKWTATISGQIPCTRQFLYNKNKLLSKVIASLPSGKTKEWLYNEKGDVVAIVKNDEITQKYEYNYNQKGELIGIKEYSYDRFCSEKSFLYDEKGNKVQYNVFCSEDKDLEDERKVFINFYKNEMLTKQEILYYSNGDKEFLLFDEQGRVTQKQYFEHKPYRDFVLKESINYKYFEDKIECTYIDNNLYKEVIVCKDIEYLEEFYRHNPFYNWNDFLFSENIFSYIEYDPEGYEIKKTIFHYFRNEEWEAIIYRRRGNSTHIVRKECTIL